MTTPIEILLDPISLIILALYAFLMAWEWIFPARELPKVKYWNLKELSSFVVFFYLSSYLPILIDPYLAKYCLFDLSHLGTISGALVGILLYEFGVFIWHYALHKSDFLWRTFHQMHHAKGVHKHNYSDIPVFDMIFGTFHNPKVYTHETGFYHGASARIGEMILFKDVSKPKKTVSTTTSTSI